MSSKLVLIPGEEGLFVTCIASLSEDLKARLNGERLRGRNHTLRSVND